MAVWLGPGDGVRLAVAVAVAVRLALAVGSGVRLVVAVGVTVGLALAVGSGVRVGVAVSVEVGLAPATVTEPLAVLTGTCGRPWLSVSCTLEKVRALLPVFPARQPMRAKVPLPFGPAGLPKLNAPKASEPAWLLMVGPSAPVARPVLPRKLLSITRSTCSAAGLKARVNSNAPRSTALSICTAMVKTVPGCTVLVAGSRRMVGGTAEA